MIFAKYAAPGMCNPADPEPCTSGTPSQAQIDNDHRSLAQRQHDALIAVGRIALMSGELGQLNGLPVSIIIRTTLQDLESRAGVGVTGGGTILPITDVIRLAAHANHYLAVFDGATGSALDLFRARRVASPAQRIMLIGREGGCTKPCCTVGAYGSQVHHVVADWVDGGNTNVDELGLACGADNRMVDQDGGWTTSINARGEVEWAPPPHLDTGQARVNHYHRPERLLHPPDDEPEPADEPEYDTDTGEPPPPEPVGDGGCREPQPLDPVADDDDDQPCGATDEPDSDTGEPPPPEPIGDSGCRAPEPFHPMGDDDADQPDEPERDDNDTGELHRPNRSGTAAAANRNRSTSWGTVTPMSAADPRRPTTKRPEGRSVSGVRTFSDPITTELTAPSSTVACGLRSPRSTTTAGRPPSTPTAKSNGPRHSTPTPAKHASTTITTPKACSTTTMKTKTTNRTKSPNRMRVLFAPSRFGDMRRRPLRPPRR